MSFIAQVTISIVIYFLVRFFYKNEKSLNIAVAIGCLSYILIYLLTYEFISILPTIHFMVTGLSLLFIFVAYNEIIFLERKPHSLKSSQINKPSNINDGYML